MREEFQEVEAGRGRDVCFERGRRGWMECSGGKREENLSGTKDLQD